MNRKDILLINVINIVVLTLLLAITDSHLPMVLLAIPVLSFLMYANTSAVNDASALRPENSPEQEKDGKKPGAAMKDKRETDSLTGLYTRNYFLNRLEGLIEKGGHKFTIYSIDLNKFKIINDLQGHHIGDVVLKEVGARLKALNNDELFFARFGGDEFVALFANTAENRINEVGSRIKDAIKRRIAYDKFEYEIGASIGVARYPDDGQTSTDLLKLADFAMYHAKKNDLNDCFLITEDFNRQLVKRKRYEHMLREMDPQRDLLLYFQPHFSMETDKPVGVEVVVKWPHAVDGLIDGDEFMPLAEEMGIIQHVTKWMFLSAIAQIREWNEKYNLELTVNLNVSQSCMYHRIFFSNVSHMVDTLRIKPHWLRISLNEFTAMHAPDYIKNLLHSIDDLGVEISLNDFGSGQVCIGLIKHLYAKYLKISASIIDDLEYDRNKYDTLKGVVMMAEGMGIRTIVKGVQNAAQLKIVRDLRCDIALGPCLSEPLLKEDFERKFLDSPAHNPETPV